MARTPEALVIGGGPVGLEQQREWRRLFGLEPGTSQPARKDTSLAPCMPASGADFAALVTQLNICA